MRARQISESQYYQYLRANLSQELKTKKFVTTLSGRVILLEKMREAGVEFLPYCADNGTVYKIRTTLMPGKFVKEEGHMD